MTNINILSILLNFLNYSYVIITQTNYIVHYIQKINHYLLKNFYLFIKTIILMLIYIELCSTQRRIIKFLQIKKS